MARPPAACAVAVWLLAAAAVPRAHHSFAAEFDARRPVTLDGVIAVVEWVNPHSMLWIDVRGASGAVDRWGLELPPPNGLLRRGVRRAMLRPGDRVRVRAYPARDGRRVASVQSFTLASGLRVTLGPLD
ncbi:MAG: DUF6152 family protein [Vicinamibacterales bacterium]